MVKSENHYPHWILLDLHRETMLVSLKNGESTRNSIGQKIRLMASNIIKELELPVDLM